MSTTTSSERTKLGYGLREEEGEDFWLFGALATIKISAEDTAGRYCVINTEVAPGVGSPWHVHRDEDEWFFVHEGECEVYIGDAHLTLTAGGFAFGPKGVPHTFFAGPMGGRCLSGRRGVSSRGSSERSLSLPPSTLCHRRLKVHRTWSYSCPSRKSGRTTSSGPRVHPPGAKSITRTSECSTSRASSRTPPATVYRFVSRAEPPEEPEPPNAEHVEAVGWLLPVPYLLGLLALDATGARVGDSKPLASAT